MQKHYNYLDIDLDNKNYRRLKAIQGDIKSRYILVNLYSNNLTYDLTDCTVKIYGLKKDKTIFFNNAIITNALLGQFEIELTNQALAIAGELKIQILILGAAGEKLSSSAFFIDVGESIIDENAIESTNEFNAFVEGLAGLAEYDIYKQNVANHEKKLDDHSSQIKETTNKTYQALSKAENPLAALKQAGWKVEKTDLSDELLKFINGGTITDSKGLENNKGIDYPLRSITRNGEITVIGTRIKDAILDIKVVGAKPNKYYRIQYLGNGTTAWGNPFYGVVVHEHDKNTFASDSDKNIKVIVKRQNNYKEKPNGITTWEFKNDLENITITITIDFSVLDSDYYNFDHKSNGYSSIIDESCYIYENSNRGSLNTNTGIEYPFKNILRDGELSSSINDEIKLGVLDVKIINAKPNKKYKIDWIGNGTTAFGDPEYAIYLQEMDDNFQNIKQIFDRKNAHLDEPQNDIETRFITTDDTDIILSITIDYAKLQSSNYTMNSYGNMGYSSIIDESCYILKKSDKVDNNKLSVLKTGDTYLIKSPYNDSKNIVWKFSSLGINEILHLTAIYFQPASAIGFDSLELFQSIGTDWISPYNFSAKNNTLNASKITTGGNHGTDSGGGFRTAYPEYRRCYIKGIRVLDDGIYPNLDEVVLEAKTNIASSNVINLDTGEGFRGVITEFITYTITPKTVKAMISILCNEDVVFRTYAGPQISSLGTTYKNISFGGDTNPTIISDISSGFRTGTKAEGSKVDRFVCEHDTGYVVAYKDKNVGINDLKYMDDNTGIGQVTGTKAYLKNFENTSTDFSKGDSFYYNCTYSFNKKYDCEGSLRAYKVNDIYIADFDKAKVNTFFKVDKEDVNKKVEIIDSSNVNIDNYSISLGVKLSAMNKGWIKFKLI